MWVYKFGVTSILCKQTKQNSKMASLESEFMLAIGFWNEASLGTSQNLEWSVDALNTLLINRIVTMELLYRSHMQKITENQKEQC